MHEFKVINCNGKVF